jgi:hypothetical protein
MIVVNVHAKLIDRAPFPSFFLPLPVSRPRNLRLATLTLSFAVIVLRDDDVRRREQHGDRRYDGKECEGDETEPVEHHRRKLPVVLDRGSVLVVADLVRDDSDLLEDEAQLSVDTGRERGRRGQTAESHRVARADTVEVLAAAVDFGRGRGWQRGWGHSGSETRTDKAAAAAVAHRRSGRRRRSQAGQVGVAWVVGMYVGVGKSGRWPECLGKKVSELVIALAVFRNV